MNYIWESVIKEIQENTDLKNIKFSVAEVYSPYMEISKDYINTSRNESEIEINPYYRFYDVFKDICDVNFIEEKSTKDFIFDVMIHFLSSIDLNQGLNKIEYHMKFIREDILSGYLGDNLKNYLPFFERNEQLLLIRNVYRLYTTGEEIYLLKNTIKNIFKNSIVYISNSDNAEVVVFLNTIKNKETIKKIDAIVELFLPINYSIDLYWNNHFGIIGIDETMNIDHIQLH